MRGIFIAGLLLLAGCTKQVEVTSIHAGKDYSGLSDYERQQFDWAAIDVDISPSVARWFRRAQSSNVSLYLFRCRDPGNFYPADARLRGKLFNYEALREPLNAPVTLTFYVPRHVQERERYGCAALDARGYSPVFFHSQTMRLPALSFVSLRRS